MHGAARLFPPLFAGSDRGKIRSAAAASTGVHTRVRTHNGFEIPPGESRRETLTAGRLLARFEPNGRPVAHQPRQLPRRGRQGRQWPALSAATKSAEAVFGTW